MNPESLPPLSLYIHIPWCVRKCPYCDFNSHQKEGELPERDYVARLLDDLDRDLDYVQGRSLESIFIGGGTPSLFSAGAFGTLLTEIDRRIPFAENCEITLEANPGTAEQSRFTGYRAAGIDRLSIGVQSFDARQLRKLGRIHDAAEALRAADFARKAGFDNFNLDLMFALPEQSVAQALSDLRQAIALAPAHISWYQLTIEPNTEFYSRPPATPDDETTADMQQAGIDLLHQAGYRRYEISAYAQAQRESRHNLNYWRFGDYLGIGAGAHGKVTLASDLRILRTRKTRMPEHYLDTRRDPTTETRTVARVELPLEFMMNVLRLSDGCDTHLYEQRTGLSLDTISHKVQLLRDRALLCNESHLLKPTARGQQYLNELLLEFM